MEKLYKFRKLGLSESALQALKIMGFEEPTPIQEKVIPILLKGKGNIIGRAQTGMGKTAAFGLPLIEKIKEDSKDIQALILVPTRELAIQVLREMKSLKGEKEVQIVCIYGGQSMEQQLRRLKGDMDIVVGTPERILDHINRKTLNFKKISYMVLDEADEMLNMGFIEDVEEILKSTNAKKRMLLFSATMPARILSLAAKYMGKHKTVTVKRKRFIEDLKNQIYFEVNAADKFEALCRIIDDEDEFYGLLFCRTRVDVDGITRKLIDRGYDADAIHGDMSQYQRERILDEFKKRRRNILIATNVNAGDIHIENLTHVINYSLPWDSEPYINRMWKETIAITFVTPTEYRKLIFAKRAARGDIRKEKLPGVKDLMNLKKSRIKAKIIEVIKSEDYDEYLELAQEMLKRRKAEKLLAALMKYSLHGELGERGYTEATDVTVDKKGKTRLFIARGKADGLTLRKLVNSIKKATKVDVKKIEDVEIFDKFSLITAPFLKAEVILKSFRRKKRKKRPVR